MREELKKQHSRNRLKNSPLAVRVDGALETLSNTDVSPIAWYRHFGELEGIVARKYRPEGECLGIELEFLCKKGSEMSNWSVDDFPEFRFGKFKSDGSINPVDENEYLPAYQELFAA